MNTLSLQETLEFYSDLRKGTLPLLGENLIPGNLGKDLEQALAILTTNYSDEIGIVIANLRLHKSHIDRIINLRELLSQIDFEKQPVYGLHQHFGSSTEIAEAWVIGTENIVRGIKKRYEPFHDSLTLKPGETNYESSIEFYDLIEGIQSGKTQAVHFLSRAILNLHYNQGLVTGAMRYDPNASDSLFNSHPEIRMNVNKRTGSTRKGQFMDGGIDLQGMMFAICEGMRTSRSMSPNINAGLIICFGLDVPHEGNLLQLEQIQKACEQYPGVIVGFDIAGNEENYPYSDEERLKQFSSLYASAPRLLGQTMHLLETRKTSPYTALKVLESFPQLERIGHGIAAAQHFIDDGYKKGSDSEHLLKELSRRGITLEICGLSNICNGMVKDFQELGEILKVFDDYGVRYAYGQTDATEFHQVNQAGEIIMGLASGFIYPKQIQLSLENAADCTFLASKYGYRS